MTTKSKKMNSSALAMNGANPNATHCAEPVDPNATHCAEKDIFEQNDRVRQKLYTIGGLLLDLSDILGFRKDPTYSTLGSVKALLTRISESTKIPLNDLQDMVEAVYEDCSCKKKRLD